MAEKLYDIFDSTLANVEEPAVAYRRMCDTSIVWNPNLPFLGTQEEWHEHFSQIENETFVSLETANKEFDQWKKIFLANKL